MWHTHSTHTYRAPKHKLPIFLLLFRDAFSFFLQARASVWCMCVFQTYRRQLKGLWVDAAAQTNHFLLTIHLNFILVIIIHRTDWQTSIWNILLLFCCALFILFLLLLAVAAGMPSNLILNEIVLSISFNHKNRESKETQTWERERERKSVEK